MSKYPRRRPSAKEALEHEWFKKFDGSNEGEAVDDAAEEL